MRAACGFLPPYVLKELAEADHPDVREAARETLSVTAAFRQNRIDTPSLTAPAPPTEFVLTRTVYDTSNSMALPGTEVRGEGTAPTLDGTVNRAYESLGLAFAFLQEVYGRHSVDDANLPLDATVHYRRRFNNALWNGSQMIFGDGDGLIFNDFTLVIDIPTHEIFHGVTQYTAGLVYQDEAGALNESVSDVFGSLAKQYGRQQTADQADWLIGAGLFTPAVRGQALRSLKDPGSAFDDPKLGGKDPQPKHMADYVHTQDDHGAVHYNSGIPNHAFYLAAIAIGGFAWEKTGRIWYETMTSGQLPQDCTFRQFAEVTTNTAKRLYNSGSELAAVEDAWRAVGV
ncbi:M4 family metallopeptidase [Streptomyces longwoodensis]|uniref:M4 family metallopeptidase n=1 Tax=Streptomyces longwoodensis TaxID=68231 RepID=UPI0036F5BF6E